MEDKRKMIERRLFRAREAAEVLGLSKSKIHLMINSGEIESVRIGRSVRIPARALDALTEGRQPEPATGPKAA